MTYFPDLGTETQIAEGSHVRAIGWLHPDHSFSIGDTAPAALERVRQFITLCSESEDALHWPVAMGLHACEFCGACSAGGNFGVPHGEDLFVAPELLLHYMDAHRYLPPSDFLNALLASPLPSTPEYLAAVARFVEPAP